jgi:asparagine synthase (glutamine-hydrolysing)
MLAELRPFLDETFSTASLGACPWLQPTEVQQVWADYKTKRDTRAWSRVWTLAVLIAFANRRTAP